MMVLANALEVLDAASMFMVCGLLLMLISGLLVWLLVVLNRPGRRRARAADRRARAAQDRAAAALMRAQSRQDRAIRRRSRGAPWSSTGMNVLLLLLLMAPASDRLPLLL